MIIYNALPMGFEVVKMADKTWTLGFVDNLGKRYIIEHSIKSEKKANKMIDIYWEKAMEWGAK